MSYFGYLQWHPSATNNSKTSNPTPPASPYDHVTTSANHLRGCNTGSLCLSAEKSYTTSLVQGCMQVVISVKTRSERLIGFNPKKCDSKLARGCWTSSDHYIILYHIDCPWVSSSWEREPPQCPMDPSIPIRYSTGGISWPCICIFVVVARTSESFNTFLMMNVHTLCDHIS